MTPEGKVKAKVNAMLKALGADCWRFMPVQTGYGAPALDYLLCIKGRFVAIETKAPGKTPTPLQESTIATMRAAGASVFVVDDDISLYIALRCIQRSLGAQNGSCLDADWQRDANLQTKDEGACKEYLRQFIKGKTPSGPTSRDHGAS